MNLRATLSVALLACFGVQAAEVRIAVFGLFHPASVEVTRPNASEIIVSVPGRIERRFRGRLDLIRDGIEVVPVVTMDLEDAVASIVAAESPPGAGLESLKAQAVVARSYLIGARGRHPHADFCDTTHCQFLRELPLKGTLASKATHTTTGVVLTSDGRVLAALYSADCGGSTRSGPYPFFGVACPLRTGVPSGHRYGLCQTGAAVMARDGATWKDILRRYFPAAAITSWN